MSPQSRPASLRSWLAGVSFLFLLLASLPARAEVDSVRIAQPSGLLYLPGYVVADGHMIEERASAGSDMLLAGDADVAMGGFGPALTLWDRTREDRKVRGMLPLCSSPIMLVTTDPRIRSIRDFTDKDWIALNAIKVTDSAITLQMAAREWGWEGRFRLDPLTVSLSNPAPRRRSSAA
jgi:NitT/TauT family transport system substrate-binding protein